MGLVAAKPNPRTGSAVAPLGQVGPWSSAGVETAVWPVGVVQQEPRLNAVVGGAAGRGCCSRSHRLLVELLVFAIHLRRQLPKLLLGDLKVDVLGPQNVAQAQIQGRWCDTGGLPSWARRGVRREFGCR